MVSLQNSDPVDDDVLFSSASEANPDENELRRDQSVVQQHWREQMEPGSNNSGCLWGL